MAGWAGFSDEELRKLQQKDQGMLTASSRGRKPATTNRSRQQLQRERALQIAAQQKAGQGLPGLSPEQQLDQPPPQTVSRPAEPVPTPVPLTPEELPETLKKETMVSNNAPALVKEAPIAKELEKDEVEVLFTRLQKTRLECLQQEQKLIEERNKRKKALLTKTIAEKSKQTQAETVKLKRIQKEVQALDDMVSNDIGILRGKIEQASWDYNVARKRYEKAEAEYVTAKLDLHKKTDIKEMLTEHLFAIIQQNELRKALKLEELLQQLQLQATEEELERNRDEEEQEKRKSGVEINGEGVNPAQAASENDVTPGLEGKTQGLGGDMSMVQELLTEPKTSDQECIILDTYSQEQKESGSSLCTS